MRRLLAKRVDRWSALGEAAMELARAEGAALQSELEGGARRLVGVLTLFALALFTLFWALGALFLTLVEVGAQWLPRWAAALAVTALLALVAAVLVLVARRRLARLETPAATVRRRAEEYQRWWGERFPARGGERRRGAAGQAPPRADPSPPADA